MDTSAKLADGRPHVANSDRLIVVVGPAGAGKASVIDAWLRLQFPASPVRLVRRVTTRVPSDRVIDEEIVSVAEFHALAARQALATAWHAHGHSYGVRPEGLLPLASREWMVLNGSRVHLAVLREQAPDLLVVEITASPGVRAAHLVSGSQRNADEVLKRLDRRTPDPKADLTLVNDGKPPATALQLQRWWLHLRARPRLLSQCGFAT